MVRKRILMTVLTLCFLFSALCASPLLFEAGVSSSLSHASHGGAESLVGSVSVDASVGTKALALDCSASLNKSLFDITRFASIPSGYTLSLGLRIPLFSVSDGASFSFIPTLREVYFKEQDRWYLQVGANALYSKTLNERLSFDFSLGSYWNQGFVSAPVSVGLKTVLGGER